MLNLVWKFCNREGLAWVDVLAGYNLVVAAITRHSTC